MGTEKCLRYELLPLEIVSLLGPTVRLGEVADLRSKCRKETGIQELTCGSQAPIATLLFDPSMSALPIIVLQKAQRVGLFTR